MTKTLEATYRDGIFKLKEPLDLEPEAQVRIRVELEERDDDVAATDWDAFEAFAGCIDDAPRGVPLAREHDEHLYK